MQTTITNSLVNKGKSSSATDAQKATYTALQTSLPDAIQASFAYGNTDLLKATYSDYINGYYFTKANGYFDKMKEVQTQQDAYKLNYAVYYQKYQALFNRYNFEFAMYDEIEQQRDEAEDDFTYPYGKRKTVLGRVSTVAFDEAISGYEFQQQEISFRLSDVCQEQYYTNPIQRIFDQITEILTSLGLLSEEGEEETETTDEDEEVEDTRSDKEKLYDLLPGCKEEHHFVKLKYDHHEKDLYQYSDFYDAMVMDERILGSFLLKLDRYKTTQTRSSTPFFILLARVGGLAAALQMLFGIVGGFISTKLLVNSVASKLFVRKKGKTEQEAESMRKGRENFGDETTQKIEKQFAKIKLSPYDVISDSVLSVVLCCCINNRNLKKFAFKKRLRIIAKCEEQFVGELSIEKILKKVRDSYAMIGHLPHSKELKPLLKYNKNNVMELTESDEDDVDSDSHPIDDSMVELSQDYDDEKTPTPGVPVKTKDLTPEPVNDYFIDTVTSRFDLDESQEKHDIVQYAIKRSLVQGLPFEK